MCSYVDSESYNALVEEVDKLKTENELYKIKAMQIYEDAILDVASFLHSSFISRKDSSKILSILARYKKKL